MKLNVLIVEDEPLISIFIKRIVLNMGENVLAVCSCGEDAVEIIKKEKPNLIFMDININGPLDGISVLRTAMPNYSPTVFFVTAYGDEETINDALSLNPYNYLIKPVKESDIEIAIRLAKKEQLKLSSAKKQNLNDVKYIHFDDDYKWDLNVKVLYYKNEVVNLTNYESLLIERLLKTPNQTVSYEDLHYYVYLDKKYSFHAIASLIKRLRKKIPKDVIISAYNEGYKIKIFET